MYSTTCTVLHVHVGPLTTRSSWGCSAERREDWTDGRSEGDSFTVAQLPSNHTTRCRTILYLTHNAHRNTCIILYTCFNESEKEGRTKQARSNKQTTRQSNTAHVVVCVQKLMRFANTSHIFGNVLAHCVTFNLVPLILTLQFFGVHRHQIESTLKLL